MKEYLKNFNDKALNRAILGSFAWLLVSLVINFYAGTYATMKVSNHVTDIILDNIPYFDINGIFIYGIFVVVGFMAAIAFKHIRRLPFMVKSIALFVIIRSAFITLTHLGPFPTSEVFDPTSFAKYFMFGGDLFFSGHTGLPFLIALILWDYKVYRYAFISFAVIFGALALMGHLHYSIDVFAAFFITYAIYHLALQLFRKDYDLDPMSMKETK